MERALEGERAVQDSRTNYDWGLRSLFFELAEALGEAHVWSCQ